MSGLFSALMGGAPSTQPITPSQTSNTRKLDDAEGSDSDSFHSATSTPAKRVKTLDGSAADVEHSEKVEKVSIPKSDGDKKKKKKKAKKGKNSSGDAPARSRGFVASLLVSDFIHAVLDAKSADDNMPANKTCNAVVVALWNILRQHVHPSVKSKMGVLKSITYYVGAEWPNFALNKDYTYNADLRNLYRDCCFGLVDLDATSAVLFNISMSDMKGLEEKFLNPANRYNSYGRMFKVVFLNNEETMRHVVATWRELLSTIAAKMDQLKVKQAEKERAKQRPIVCSTSDSSDDVDDDEE